MENILTELFANKATFAGDEIIPLPGAKFSKEDFLAKIEKYKSNKDDKKEDKSKVTN